MPRRAIPALALVSLAIIIPTCAGTAAAGGPDRGPDIFLLSPLDRSTVNGTTVELRWTSVDPDRDLLSFVVELSDGAGFNLTRRTAAGSLTLELPDRSNFSWRVTASDGTANATSPYSRFSVHVNRGPVIHSVPVLEAGAGRTYEYRVLATDPDSDALTYRLVEEPGNMGMTPDGKVLWVPWSGQAGKAFKVAIIVSDGELEERQEFGISVAKAKATGPAGAVGTAISPWIAGGLATVLVVEIIALFAISRRPRNQF